MKNLFSSEEISLLIPVLEVYPDAPLQLLERPVRDGLLHSSIGKLQSLTPLTHFTKQEFTLMYMAVDSVLRLSELDAHPLPDDLVALFNRLEKMATPD